MDLLDNKRHDLRRYLIAEAKIRRLEDRRKAKRITDPEEYRIRIKRLRDRASGYRREISKEIRRVKDPRLISILDYKYLKGLSNEKLSKIVGISDRYSYTLEAQALRILIDYDRRKDSRTKQPIERSDPHERTRDRVVKDVKSNKQ